MFEQWYKITLVSLDVVFLLFETLLQPLVTPKSIYGGSLNTTYITSKIFLAMLISQVNFQKSRDRGPSRLRLSEFVQISEFFSIYITDICQTSESFAKSVNLK